MKFSINFKLISLLIISTLMVASCKGPDGKFKLPGGDARKTPADPKKRIEQNLSQGKGFRFNNLDNKNKGVFDFASSNELWRASLDVIEFMPLSSVNYSGGIIITDWYSTTDNQNERCKLNVYISGKSLNTENLKVTSFCQEFKDQIWVNIDVDKDSNIKIENAILNRAKKLRLQSS